MRDCLHNPYPLEYEGGGAPLLAKYLNRRQSKITSTVLKGRNVTLVIISAISLAFSRKFLPVLVFTGIAPPTRHHQ